MRILIAGAGTIGHNLALSLTNEGQDVVVLDTNHERLLKLENSVDCQVLRGSAINPATLENAGIRHTDLVIAVTENDAINCTVCRLADFYRVPEKLARIRDPELAGSGSIVPPEHLGIDHVISPELLTVDHVVRLVECPGAREAIDFEHGRIALRAMVVSEDSDVAGKDLMTLRQEIAGDYLIVAIRRGNRMIIPDGKMQVRIGDTVYILSDASEIPNYLPVFDPGLGGAKRVLIFGAGVTGTALALRLAKTLDRVVVVEPDRFKAENAAAVLDDAGVEVLEGSVLDEDLLTRTGVDRMDFFIAASDDDEENFMGALLFRRYGAGAPIVITSKAHYLDILDSVDLDLVINPRVLAVGAILRHLRGSTVLSVAKLGREDAEMVEFKVTDKSLATSKPLKALSQHMPKGLIIGAVLRGQELFIPGGDFQIRSNDRVLVFSDGRATDKAREIFR